MNNPIFIVVDLFAGAGGVTEGFERADGVAEVIACVNHDANAIRSHAANHPDCVHFTEDIRTVEMYKILIIVERKRRQYPDAKLILWASLECTNFSKAKGGQPRDADSRTLADHMDRYVEALNPELIMIENVVEFMAWGPLDEHGKPVSRRNGCDWLAWKRRICDYGYHDEWKQLNSADYGAYTSRNRLFGCFARHGMDITWPKATHSKVTNSNKDLFGGTGLKPWKAVKEVLDFEDEGKSIFERSKPLSEKTLERIYAGLIKFIAGGKDNFLAKIYAVASNSHGTYSTESAAHTITTRDAHALVQPAFLSRYYGGNPEFRNHSVDDPAGVIRTAGCHALVQTAFISKYYSGRPEGKNIPVDGPAGTITTIDSQALVQPNFIQAYYGSGSNNHETDKPAPVIRTRANLSLIQPKYLMNYHHSSDVNDVNKPCPTLTTRDKIAVVHPVPFIYRDFTGGGQHSSIEQPAGTVMPSPKMNLVQPFVMHTNFSNQPTSVDNPHPVITANRKWSYLINPSWGGNPGSTESPAPVIVARQDKAPMYLVVTDNGQWAIEIYDTDTEMTKKIKEFMALYAIADIKMRMLKVSELKKIQGFPEDYYLEGNQSEQKKFIGNSVVPHVVSAWAKAMATQFTNIKETAA